MAATRESAAKPADILIGSVSRSMTARAFALVVLCAACSESVPTSTPSATSRLAPRYSGGGIGGTLEPAGNGLGQCLLGDTQDAGFINNASDLNCNANDVSLDLEVTSYALNGGPYSPLLPGQAISCEPGDLIRAVAEGTLTQNANSPRF